MSLKSRVEAVLFLTDKPVVAAVVAKLCNEDLQLVRQAILELIHDYEERNCALEIANDDDGYMMQVKDEYSNVANDLAPIDLPLAVVRTLSAIAIKQPVMQSDIVRIRGAGAYEHIKELLEKELISKKEEGRSPLLSTTKKFQTYFRLSQDAKALRFQLKDKAAEEMPLPEDQQLQIQDVQSLQEASLSNNGHSDDAGNGDNGDGAHGVLNTDSVDSAKNTDSSSMKSDAKANNNMFNAPPESSEDDLSHVAVDVTADVAAELAVDVPSVITSSHKTSSNATEDDADNEIAAETNTGSAGFAEDADILTAPLTSANEELGLDNLDDGPTNDDVSPVAQNKFIASQRMN